MYNNVLCHHLSPYGAGPIQRWMRCVLFGPRIQRKHGTQNHPHSNTGHNQEGWGAVKEAIRLELGVDHFKTNGYSRKNISCLNPQHEDKYPSAGWHEGGYLKCFSCGAFHAKDAAKWLVIDWRALLRAQLQIVSSKHIDLEAAPRQTEADRASLTFDEAPDTWLRLLIKFFKPTEALLFLFTSARAQSRSFGKGLY